MMVVTNALGVAFTATLLSVGDAGAVFVFPEDGATNTLAFSQLSEESARRVCEAAGFVRIPPSVASAFSFAQNSLRRIDALVADGRMDAGAARRRKSRIIRAFECTCREKGVSDAELGDLRLKLGGR